MSSFCLFVIYGYLVTNNVTNNKKKWRETCDLKNQGVNAKR